MAHPDDVSPLERAINQMERLYQESFRMADRLIMKGGADDFQSVEAREKSLALVPLVALDIKNHLQQCLNLDEVPPRHLEKAQESTDEIIAIMKKKNDEASEQS